MEEIKNENKIENKEHVPSKVEILGLISTFLENTEIVQEESNEDGLFLLHTKGSPDTKGEFTQYEYIKKGDYVGFGGGKETILYATEFDADGIPFTGRNIASYNHETNTWYHVNDDNSLGGKIETSLENKENISNEINLENNIEKDTLQTEYKKDQESRNELQEKLNGENFNEVKPEILKEEQDMRDIQNKIDGIE